MVCACIEGGIDYLDVCGEPEFMERMAFRYNESAAQQGSLIVSACGFDSIPADLGVIFAVRKSHIQSPPFILCTDKTNGMNATQITLDVFE